MVAIANQKLKLEADFQQTLNRKFSQNYMIEIRKIQDQTVDHNPNQEKSSRKAPQTSQSSCN